MDNIDVSSETHLVAAAKFREVGALKRFALLCGTVSKRLLQSIISQFSRSTNINFVITNDVQ